MGPFSALRRAASACFAVALVAGCGAAAESTPAAHPGPVVDPAAPSVVAPPDTPAGRQLAWVLRGLAETPAASDVETHFVRSFLEQVPASKVIDLFSRVKTEMGPCTLDGIEPGAQPNSLVAVVRAADRRLIRINVVTEASGDGKMTGLLLKASPQST